MSRIMVLLLFAVVVGGANLLATPSVARASQTDCLSYGYACTPGYTGANAAGTWAWSHYGAGYAQTANGYHNCTLYAAWRLEQNGMGDPGNWGDAVDWASHNGGGNNTPAVGAIAWWGAEVAGGSGHVAYVDQVSGNQVHVVADNFPGSASQNGYTDSGWIAASSVDKFLHPHDVSGGGALPDGSLVRTPNQNVYRIVGGAPLHISRCDYTNGCAGVVDVPDLSGYLSVPRDGALVRNVDNGAIYEVVGGAPLHLGSCAYTDCGQSVNVDSYPINALDHLNAVPSNGSLIRDGAAGAIYDVVGGAPLHLGTCKYTGGGNCGGVVNLDSYPINALDHLRAVPANGSLIRNADNGAIYEVVGGAPLHLGSCAYTDCGQSVNVDSYPINALDHLNAVPSNGSLIRDGAAGAIYDVVRGAPLHLGTCKYTGGGNCGGVVNLDSYPINALDHLRAVPANGSLIRNADNGAIYEVVGGAPLHLGSCAYTDCGQSVNVDSYPINALDHLNAVPSNGSFIRDGATGANYRTVGGAAFLITNCTTIGGCSPETTVDGYPLSTFDHLRHGPPDGTILIGLPSGQAWIIYGGKRSPTTTKSGSVAVNDATLTSIALASTGPGSGAGSGSGNTGTGTHAGTSCVVPDLKHMTLAHARAVLHRSHCQLGRITRPRHPRRHHILRVSRQGTRAGTVHPAGYHINIALE